MFLAIAWMSISTIILGDKHNVLGVEPIEVYNMKVAKEMNSSHNVIFYNSPTLFEEHPYDPPPILCALSHGLCMMASLTSF